jgi:phosphate transport system substrate-binding protein
MVLVPCFASKAAQTEFNKANPDVDVIVESHGTGGGFGRYLAGEVDIVDASREAKEDEVKGAVGDLSWTKHLVAYDGITVARKPQEYVR